MATRKKRIVRKSKQQHEEGWEDFNLKVEWFSRYRDTSGGISLKEVYEAAVRHAKRMDRFVHETPDMPERPIRKATLGLAQGTDATVSETRNPHVRGAIGFASNAVQITGKERIANSVLFLPLDPKLKERVDPNTICVFRYVPKTRSWTKMPVCGMNEKGTIAWTRVHEPGTYIAIGLPNDPVVQASLLLLYMHKGQLPPSLKKEERIRVAKSILKGNGRLAVLLSGGDAPILDVAEKAAKKPGTQKMMGLGGEIGLPGGFPGDLPIPGGGLPDDGFAEWDILDDICPPWLGPGKLYIPGKWPKTPIIWPDIVFPWPPYPWDWKSIGPKNINGRIASLCNHPSDSNIIYAGAANGGVWKTTNAGLTWTHKWVDEESMAVGSIALCHNFPDTLYAATGEDTPGYGNSYPGVGVYKSVDGGTNWTLCAGTIGQTCMKILVHPTDPNTVYVASSIGFYRTTDGGATPWTLIHAGHCTDAVMDPFNPLIIYLALWNDGIYKTVDGGSNWSPANGKWAWKIVGTKLLQVWRGIPTGAAAEWIALAIGRNGANGSNFLIAKLGVDSGDVYKTTNGADTWSRIASPVQSVSYNEWTNMCAINPNNHNILFAGGVGLSRCTNGSTFSGTSGTHADHQQLIFDPHNPSICYVATDGGVYRSTDGGQNWTLRSTNLQATQLVSFGASQSGGFHIGGATQDQGIVHSLGSTTWTDNNGGNEWGIFVVDPNTASNIYISPGGSARLRQSQNGGGSWTTLSGLSDTVNGTTTSEAKTIDLAVKSGNSNVLLFAGRINDTSLTPAYNARNIWRSTNKGSSFTRVFAMTDTPTKVLFAPSNGNIAFITCSNGRVYRSGSSGSSGSWVQPYAEADRPSPGYISCIGISWYDANDIFIGYGNFAALRIMRSTDGGAHWNDISGAIPETTLPTIPLNAIAIDQYDSNKIFVATDIGVFRTTDGGVNWQNYNHGFLVFDHPRVLVTGLHVRKSDNALYSGTMGRGAYRKYL